VLDILYEVEKSVIQFYPTLFSQVSYLNAPFCLSMIVSIERHVFPFFSPQSILFSKCKKAFWTDDKVIWSCMKSEMKFYDMDKFDEDLVKNNQMKEDISTIHSILSNFQSSCTPFGKLNYLVQFLNQVVKISFKPSQYDIREQKEKERSESNHNISQSNDNLEASLSDSWEPIPHNSHKDQLKSEGSFEIVEGEKSEILVGEDPKNENEEENKIEDLEVSIYIQNNDDTKDQNDTKQISNDESLINSHSTTSSSSSLLTSSKSKDNHMMGGEELIDSTRWMMCYFHHLFVCHQEMIHEDFDIVGEVEEQEEEEEKVSDQDISPLLIHWFAEMKFVENFTRNDRFMMDQKGYAFATIYTILQSILRLDDDDMENEMEGGGEEDNNEYQILTTEL